MNTKRRSSGKEFMNNQLETTFQFGSHSQDGDGAIFGSQTKIPSNYSNLGGVINTERSLSSDPRTKSHSLAQGFAGCGRYKKNSKKQY